MTELEKDIIAHINDKKFKFPKTFNPSVDYSDEFYNEIKKVFIQNGKKRYFYHFVNWCIMLSDLWVLSHPCIIGLNPT